MFYDIFVNLCKQKDVKPSRVAIETGIPKSAVSNWKKNWLEGKEVVPQNKNLQSIAIYFDVPTDYLLGKTNGFTFDSIAFALNNEIKELSDDKKQILLELAQFLKQQQEKGK